MLTSKELGPSELCSPSMAHSTLSTRRGLSSAFHARKDWSTCSYTSQKGFESFKIPYEDSVETLQFAHYFFRSGKKNGLEGLMRKLKDKPQIFADIDLKLTETVFYQVIYQRSRWTVSLRLLSAYIYWA